LADGLDLQKAAQVKTCPLMQLGMLRKPDTCLPFFRRCSPSKLEIIKRTISVLGFTLEAIQQWERLSVNKTPSLAPPPPRLCRASSKRQTGTDAAAHRGEIAKDRQVDSGRSACRSSRSKRVTLLRVRPLGDLNPSETWVASFLSGGWREEGCRVSPRARCTRDGVNVTG
jgi:hypothetical protein